MTKKQAIETVKTDFDLIAPYILDDLKPFEWEHLDFVKGVEPFGNHFRIVGDEDLTIYKIQDITMESEYKYTLLIQVGWKSNRPQKALIKLKANLYWLIEFS